MTNKINKSKLIKRSILVLLFLACVGIFVAHKWVQRYGFEGIGEFISVYRHNQNLADQTEVQELQLKISNADYDFLKERRDVALERGIQINDGEDNYVECKIIQGGDTVKGEMRLKGHMTDHLEGDKWSFRVKTKKKPVFGMTRFSLQAPGTRNYAYEWVYHQLLKEEEIIHLNYDFIRVKLNEKDLGIYAMEEHFGQHVLEHNNRPKGAILRWNPNLYWEWRIDELQGTYLNEQYSAFSSSFVEPYEKGTVEDDSNLVETYVKGAALLESFRRGEKITSEIFDVTKLARFHAIIDLVGGHHSLDWSDVKFFYNSETGKIEPVGYESFSVRKTESIAGQRIPEDYDKLDFNYHNRLFSDPIFFAAYIQELERIADEKYFHAFIQKIQPDLDKKLGVLAHEFPYRKFTFDPYFENIELIRHNLELPKPFHAFLEASTDSTIFLNLTPVSDYPVEVISLIIDDKHEFKPDSVFILPAKARNTYAHYFPFEIKWKGENLKNIKLKARIPGSFRVFEVAVSDLPSYKSNQQIQSVPEVGNEKPVSMMTQINDSILFFSMKDVTLDEPLVIAEGQILKVFPGQQIRFLKGGALFCEGKIEMIGGSEDDERIMITAEKTSGHKINSDRHVVLKNAELSCMNVDFYQAEDFVMAEDSRMNFKFCAFAETAADFITSTSSEMFMIDCSSGSLISLGFFDRSLVRIKNFGGKHGTVFIRSNGSDIDLFNVQLEGYESVAELNYNSGLTAWNSSFAVSSMLADLKNASSCRFLACIVEEAPIGFKLDADNGDIKLPGQSVYELYKTPAENIGTIEVRFEK